MFYVHLWPNSWYYTRTKHPLPQSAIDVYVIWKCNFSFLRNIHFLTFFISGWKSLWSPVERSLRFHVETHALRLSHRLTIRFSQFLSSGNFSDFHNFVTFNSCGASAVRHLAGAAMDWRFRHLCRSLYTCCRFPTPTGHGAILHHQCYRLVRGLSVDANGFHSFPHLDMKYS